MKKIFTLALISIFSFSSYAIMLEDVVIKGEIKSITENGVTIVDSMGKVHKIKKSDLPKHIKLAPSKKISIALKVKASQFAFSRLPYELEDISKLKKDDIIKLLYSYQAFIASADQEMSGKTPYKAFNEEDEKYTDVWRYILDSAFADDPPNYTCFWGGWPTNVTSGGNCQSPHHSGVQNSMEATDPLKYHSCSTGGNVYRCNPVIFGASTQTNSGEGLGAAAPATGAPSVQVRPVPESDAANGICIVVSNPSQIVERCLTAAAPNFLSIVEAIKSNPAKTAAFERFAASVAAFCRDGRNSSNAACGNLRERLAAIEMGRHDSVRRTADGSCVHQEHGSFGQSIGARTEGANSCPGSLCYVRASCTPAQAGASPLEITAVCGCNYLGSADSSEAVPDSGQMLACINDQSIATLNRSTPAAAPVVPGAGPASER